LTLLPYLVTQTETTRLRRARRRVVAQIRKLQPLVARYQAKLGWTDARLQELDPERFIPPRRYWPNPVFARQELPWIAMAIMREGGKPLPVGVIAVRALARKA
jgi:hypothetical protein